MLLLLFMMVVAVVVAADVDVVTMVAQVLCTLYMNFVIDISILRVCFVLVKSQHC